MSFGDTPPTRHHAPTGEHREPWERHPDEEDLAWRAFQLYRDMPLPRSLRKIAEQLGNSGHTSLGRLSGKHEWQRRVQAWDLELDRLRREKLARDNIAAGERHASIAASGLQVAAKVNVAWLTRSGIDETLLTKMTFDELSDLMVRVNRIVPRLVVAERLARGMSTEHREVSGSVDVHRQEVDGWTDEQLDAFLLGAAAGAERRVAADVESDA